MKNVQQVKHLKLKPTITIIFRIQITYEKVKDGNGEQSYEHVDGLVFDKNIHKYLKLKNQLLMSKQKNLQTKLDTLELFDEATEGLLGQDEE